MLLQMTKRGTENGKKIRAHEGKEGNDVTETAVRERGEIFLRPAGRHSPDNNIIGVAD